MCTLCIHIRQGPLRHVAEEAVPGPEGVEGAVPPEVHEHPVQRQRPGLGGTANLRPVTSCSPLKIHVSAALVPLGTPCAPPHLVTHPCRSMVRGRRPAIDGQRPRSGEAGGGAGAPGAPGRFVPWPPPKGRGLSFPRVLFVTRISTGCGGGFACPPSQRAR